MALGNQELLEFVQRFRNLQIQRDSSDALIKACSSLPWNTPSSVSPPPAELLLTENGVQDLLIYCEGVETDLRNENSRLAAQLNDAQLDLADATKSRRELQQRLQTAEARIGYISHDNDLLKVTPRAPCPSRAAGNRAETRRTATFMSSF